jgi:signal peptidase II
MPWTPRARLFWPFLVALLVADCATKELAETYLAPEHVPHEIVGSFVRLTLTHNPGAAMSVSLGSYSRVGLSALALVVIAFLFRLYLATPVTDRIRAAALALLVGGALGNLMNRLTPPRGVVDFIDIGVPAWRFWTFNVADTGITIGALLLLRALWRERSDRESGA